MAIICGKWTALSVQNSDEAASSRSPAVSGSIRPHMASQLEPQLGQAGERFERIGDRAGEDRVFTEPVAVALVQRPLMGLAQRLASDPLPERPQPKDRLQPVGLADLPDRCRRACAEARRAARFEHHW